MKYIVFLLMLLPQIALGQNATLLDKGDKAPYKGYLIKPERVEKLVKAEKKVELQKERIVVLEDQKDVMERRLEIYAKKEEIYSEELEDYRDFNTFQKSLYFLGGATVTGVLAYGLITAMGHNR